MKNRIKVLSVILAFVMMFSVIADVLPLIASEQTISETTEEASYQDTNNDLQEEQIPEQETHSGRQEDLELNENSTYQEVSEENTSNDFTEDEIETTTEEEEVVNDNIDNKENPDFDDNATEETTTVEDTNLEENPDLSTEQPDETNSWELGLVFYDSTVNNGKTPLTEIDWDASDGSYRDGETRVITVQINYKNTNATMTYQPGELKLSINNLAYKLNSSSSAQLSSKINVGANDSTHTGYDWNFCSKESDEHYVFENNTIIEKNNNFEGTIQIQYELTPMGDNKNSYYPYYHPEEYLDECTHSCNVEIQAILDNKIESNSIFFDYIRLYKHPWERKTFEVNKTAKKYNHMMAWEKMHQNIFG